MKNLPHAPTAAELAERYADHIVNTGGNAIPTLLAGTTNAVVNLPLAMLEVAVQSQAQLLARLYSSGLLRDEDLAARARDLAARAEELDTRAENLVNRIEELEATLRDALSALRPQGHPSAPVTYNQLIEWWKTLGVTPTWEPPSEN